MKATVCVLLTMCLLILSGCVVDPLPTPGESTALSGGAYGSGGGDDQGSDQPNAGATDAVEQADGVSETNDTGASQADMVADN
ncbi:MAG TPA: hypothetical protein DCQ06_00430 [Myxococcales bacterium]|nr:hypothetical protein [Myxococcales bacterium]